MHHTLDHISYVGQQNGHPPLRHEHIHNKYIFAAMTNNHLSGMQRFTLCYRLPNAFHIETALMVPKVSYLGWSQAIPTQWQNLTSWGAIGHMLLCKDNSAKLIPCEYTKSILIYPEICIKQRAHWPTKQNYTSQKKGVDITYLMQSAV